MRPRVWWVAWVLLVGLVGCSKKAAPPLAPEPPSPPQIEEVYPPAHSTGIPYETEIWARFAEPLDSTTVNSDNVKLYLDTQIIPTTVSWEAATRRVLIRLLGSLALSRTHTVRLAPDLATADGSRLGEEYFWQFKTVGVRPVTAPFPPDGAAEESPFVMLMWLGSNPHNQEVEYDLFAGEDSAAVASRLLSPLGTTSRSYYIPESRWSRDAKIFWSVTTRNLSTGEQGEGSVWRFATLPAAAPIDSVVLSLSDWTAYSTDTGDVMCFTPRFLVGFDWKAGLRWDLAPLGPRKVAYAAIRIRSVGDRMGSLGASTATTFWNACDPSTIFEGDRLVGFTTIFGSTTSYASDDALTAHIEASTRHSGFFGYVLSGTSESQYQAVGTTLSLYYFRDAEADQ
jgi:hypothetical protein